MLHGNETWSVKKENELTLQHAEMRVIRWMCGIKVSDRFTCSEVREILEIADIITVMQQHRLRWYGHVLRKDEKIQQSFYGPLSTTTGVSRYEKKHPDHHSVFISFFHLLRSIASSLFELPPPHQNRFTALFPGPPGWDGARRELLDFMVQGKINRGRHIDHPAGRHSIRTNQCPLPPSYPYFLQVGCLSCCPTNSVKALKATELRTWQSFCTTSLHVLWSTYWFGALHLISIHYCRICISYYIH